MRKLNLVPWKLGIELEYELDRNWVELESFGLNLPESSFVVENGYNNRYNWIQHIRISLRTKLNESKESYKNFHSDCK